MKKLLKLALALIVLACAHTMYSDNNCQAQAPFYKICTDQKPTCELNLTQGDCGDIYGKTFFSVRPQDSDSKRRIISMPYEKEWRCEGSNNVSLTFEYQRSIKSNSLATWFFFNGCRSMTVGIPDAATKVDVDGSQLGLSLGQDTVTTMTPGIIGTISAEPIVSNAIFDLNFFIDLCPIAEGLWTRIDVPVVRSKTNMRFCSTGTGVTTDNFAPGLLTLNTCLTGTPVVYNNILDAFNGNRVFGDVATLKSARYSPCSQTETKIAGIHVDLGYDFCFTDDQYLAASIHAVGPTGTRPNGEFVFEPVVGANKSWQLGGTVSGYKTWCRERNDVGIYWYVVATHLFKARQTRVFNLKKNGPGSQYLLLKDIDTSANFVDGIDRAANFLSGETRIGANLMFDGSVMAAWEWERSTLELGYNFWARTHEKRASEVCFRGYNFIDSNFGVKGNEFSSTFDPDLETCVTLTSTASKSTIALAAAADPDAVSPVVIEIDDINFSAPLHPATWSHKFFGAWGRKGNLCCQDTFLQIGAAVEFGNKNSALHMVSAFAQAGIEF